RRVALHLLRHVRTSVPRRCHRIDDARRPDRPESRRDDVRQGKAAERLRPDRAHGDGPNPHPVWPAERSGRDSPARPAAGPASIETRFVQETGFLNPSNGKLASHWEASFLGGRPNHLAILAALAGITL